MRLVELGRPCWSAFSHRAKYLCSAADLMKDTATKSSAGDWQDEIHNLIFHGFFEVGHLYPSLLSDESEALNLHFQCLVELVGRRVQSLAAYYLRPPLRYSGALLNGKEEEILTQMKLEWSMVLEAENCGKNVPPLAAMHWRLNSVNRLMLLLNERSFLSSQEASAAAADRAGTLHLLRLCSCHLGDTRIIENGHQMAKASP